MSSAFHDGFSIALGNALGFSANGDTSYELAVITGASGALIDNCLETITVWYTRIATIDDDITAAGWTA